MRQLGSSAAIGEKLNPDLPAAAFRLAASGLPRLVEDDWCGGMRFLLRQKRRARAVNRAMGALLLATAWSEPAMRPALATRRHELGSAARQHAGEARGWARLGRF